MADTTYAVYHHNGSVDGDAIASEAINDDLRDDEKQMRIGQLLDRAASTPVPSGSTLVVQSSALKRS